MRPVSTTNGARTGEEGQAQRGRGRDGEGSTEKKTINHCLRGLGIGFFSHSSHLTCIRCQLNLLHTQKPTSERATCVLPFSPSPKIRIPLKSHKTKRNKRHTIAYWNCEEVDEKGDNEENTIGIYLLFDFVIWVWRVCACGLGDDVQYDTHSMRMMIYLFFSNICHVNQSNQFKRTHAQHNRQTYRKQINRHTKQQAFTHYDIVSFSSIENPIFSVVVVVRPFQNTCEEDAQKHAHINNHILKEPWKNKSHNCISIRVDRKRHSATSLWKWFSFWKFQGIQGHPNTSEVHKFACCSKSSDFKIRWNLELPTWCRGTCFLRGLNQFKQISSTKIQEEVFDSRGSKIEEQKTLGNSNNFPKNEGKRMFKVLAEESNLETYGHYQNICQGGPLYRRIHVFLFPHVLFHPYIIPDFGQTK